MKSFSFKPLVATICFGVIFFVSAGSWAGKDSDNNIQVMNATMSEAPKMEEPKAEARASREEAKAALRRSHPSIALTGSGSGEKITVTVCSGSGSSNCTRAEVSGGEVVLTNNNPQTGNLVLMLPEGYTVEGCKAVKNGCLLEAVKPNQVIKLTVVQVDAKDNANAVSQTVTDDLTNQIIQNTTNDVSPVTQP